MAALPSVLVVDDDFDVREALCDVLREEGIAVAAAADGQEALEYLRRESAPRVILLDLMMPRMDGAQFREQQRRDPVLTKIPVVLLSADTRIVDATRTLGAHGYLRKPVDLHRLIATIRRFLDDAPDDDGDDSDSDDDRHGGGHGPH